LQRLIPSLRAFNPNLILLSTGFDAALGDVGNCRHQPNSTPLRGMDLKPEDFSWATSEIMKIADICCGGRIVSVLEGGYGESGHEHETRASSKTQQLLKVAASESNGKEIDAHAMVRFFIPLVYCQK
jgi:acetoin utilization deacetylase AcuC-like enzyme